MTKHGGKSIVQRVGKEWCLIAVWGKHDAPCLIPMGQAIKEMLLLHFIITTLNNNASSSLLRACGIYM